MVESTKGISLCFFWGLLIDNPKVGLSTISFDKSPRFPHFLLKNSPIDTLRPALDLDDQ